MISASLVIHNDNPWFVTVSSVHEAKIKVGTGKKAKSTTGLLIQFSGELNSAAAQNLAAYKLLTAGKNKKFGTKSVKLASACTTPPPHCLAHPQGVAQQDPGSWNCRWT